MGVYDMLPKGSQVKCWECDVNTKIVGNIVFSFGSKVTYIVLLREGGYVRVVEHTITEIIEDGVYRYPEDFPGVLCIDKWGNSIRTRDDLRGTGIMGEDYYYSE